MGHGGACSDVPAVLTRSGSSTQSRVNTGGGVLIWCACSQGGKRVRVSQLQLPGQEGVWGVLNVADQALEHCWCCGLRTALSVVSHPEPYSRSIAIYAVILRRPPPLLGSASAPSTAQLLHLQVQRVGGTRTDSLPAPVHHHTIPSRVCAVLTLSLPLSAISHPILTLRSPPTVIPLPPLF